jgi:glycosyltransferase involved in cell wall biosynthesis
LPQSSSQIFQRPFELWSRATAAVRARLVRAVPHYRRLISPWLRTMIPVELRQQIKLAVGFRDPILKAQELRIRLNDLGFTERGLEDLDRLSSSQDQLERHYALWELAVWHANRGSERDARLALAALDRLTSDDPDPEFQRWVAVIRAECLNRVGKAEEARREIESALRKEQHPDLLLAAANLWKAESERLKHVNLALRLYDLPEVSLQNAKGNCLYDQLVVEGKLPSAKGPMVSVIVPAFNAAKHISTAMEALIAQTWEDLEVLVVDDCSCDSTPDIVADFAARDQRIRLLRTDANRGSYVARNIGLATAAGTFVTTHDSDDWSHPKKLEIQARHLLEHPDLVANMSVQARASNDLVFSRRGSPGFYIFDNMSSLMFRREVVQSRLGCWDSVRFGADSEFIERIRIAIGADAIGSVPRGLLSFQRQSEGSLTVHDLFGYHGYLTGARRVYHEVSRQYHRRCPSLRYASDCTERPFAVPAPMLPTRTVEKGQRRDFDVILAADFRHPGLVAESAWWYLESGLRQGRRIGLVQLGNFDVDPLSSILSPFTVFGEQGALELIVAGEQARCRRLVVLDINVLRDYQRYVAEIEAETLELLVPTLPPKTAPAARWLAVCAENAQRYFARPGIWLTSSERVSDALKRLEPSIEVASLPAARKTIAEFCLGPYSRPLRNLFIAGMVLAIGVNLYEFDRINSALSSNYKALFHYDDEGLFSVATRRNPSVTLRVAPFYYFGLISPGSTIIMPSQGMNSWFEFDLSMMSFGRAKELIRRPYDPQAPIDVMALRQHQVDLADYAPNRRDTLETLRNRVSIFRRSPEANVFVVFTPEGSPGREKPMILVDVELLDESIQGALR